MSVPVQVPYKQYVAAPGATVFPTTFRVVLAADLQVRVDSVVVTSGFTLSTLGLPGGVDVTFSAPMVGGEIVELQRIIPKSRVNDFQQLGDFNAAVVNAELDRIWMSVQELDESADRSIRLPAGATASAEFPPPVGSTYIGWNALGTALMNYVGVASAAVSVFMANVVAAVDAAAARLLLGAAASGANTDIASRGNNSSTVYTTGGTLPAYTLTPVPALAAYEAGASFLTNFHVAAGPAPTIAISGLATPPNLVKQLADGSYANIAANDFPANHRSRVTLLSPTQAWVETVPSTAVRAWALFDGTLGGTNAPTAGSKVTSITRNVGGGSYTVNLSVTMATANYAVVATAAAATGSAGRVISADTRTTTSFRILTESTGGVISDSEIVSFAVMGA